MLAKQSGLETKGRSLRSLGQIKAVIKNEVFNTAPAWREKATDTIPFTGFQNWEKKKKKRFSVEAHLRKKNQDSTAEAGGGGRT